MKQNYLKYKIIYDDKEIEFFLKRAHQKRIYFKYHYSSIFISAPIFLDMAVIEQFVLSSWLNFEKRHSQKKYHYLFNYIDDNKFIMLFNQKYILKILPTNKNNKWAISNNEVILNLKSNNIENITKTINKLLKKQADDYLTLRLEYWSKIMNLKYEKLQIRLMKNKWGLCYYFQKKIVLNYFLVHLPIEVIDYVLVHELAHLIEPNHNQTFWKLVEQYYLEAKAKQKFLKTIVL